MDMPMPGTLIFSDSGILGMVTIIGLPKRDDVPVPAYDVTAVTLAQIANFVASESQAVANRHYSKLKLTLAPESATAFETLKAGNIVKLSWSETVRKSDITISRQTHAVVKTIQLPDEASETKDGNLIILPDVFEGSRLVQQFEAGLTSAITICLDTTDQADGTEWRVDRVELVPVNIREVEPQPADGAQEINPEIPTDVQILLSHSTELTPEQVTGSRIHWIDSDGMQRINAAYESDVSFVLHDVGEQQNASVDVRIMLPAGKLRMAHHAGEDVLKHRAVPVQITNADVAQTQSGNSVTKVVFLPRDLKAAKAGQIQMLVDSRTDPAIDIIQQAETLGFPVAIVRMSSAPSPTATRSSAAETTHEAQPEPAAGKGKPAIDESPQAALDALQ